MDIKGVDQKKLLALQESLKKEDKGFEQLESLEKDLSLVKKEIKDDGISTLASRVYAKKGMNIINDIQKAIQIQKTYIELVKNELSVDSPTYKNDSLEYQRQIDDLEKKLKSLKEDNDYFMSLDSRTKEIFYDVNKVELLNKFLYKDGISQVVIHGADIPYANEKGEEEFFTVSKMDLDAYSALKILEMGGVKFKDSVLHTWINPKEKIQYDENGKPYYNITSKEPQFHNNGKIKQDKSGKTILETKQDRFYLPSGTLIVDMGGIFGFKMIPDGVSIFDHHGENNKKTTSATREMFDVLSGDLEFVKRFKENTNTKDLKWVNNYIDFVTKVDNLDYKITPENWKNFNNTMYGIQKFFSKENQEIIIDLFKNYPDISLDGFTAEELEYIIALGDKGYVTNDNGYKNISLKNLKPLEFDGVKKSPDFFENNPRGTFDKKIIRVKDLVEFQKRLFKYSDKAILRAEVEMHDKNLNKESPILGKVLIDEVDVGLKKYQEINPVGAVSAYGHGYDSYVILNLNGKQKNEIFVSAKKGAKEFAERLKKEFAEILGDKYKKDLVQVQRDKMVIIRGPELRSLETNKIREIIIEVLGVKNSNKQEKEDKEKSKLQETLDKLNKLYEAFNN